MLWTRSAPIPTRLALIGTTIVLGFVLIRAASFHHVDVLLKIGLGDFRLNHVLELTGIGFVGYAAWRSTREDLPAPKKLVPFERIVRIR